MDEERIYRLAMAGDESAQQCLLMLLKRKLPFRSDQILDYTSSLVREHLEKGLKKEAFDLARALWSLSRQIDAQARHVINGARRIHGPPTYWWSLSRKSKHAVHVNDPINPGFSLCRRAEPEEKVQGPIHYLQDWAEDIRGSTISRTLCTVCNSRIGIYLALYRREQDRELFEV